MNRAWTIVVFLVLFNLSFMVVGALDIWTMPDGSNPLSVSGNDFIDAIKFTGEDGTPNYLSLLSMGTFGIAIIGSAFLRLPVGAAVYAGLISANIFSLSTIFNRLSGFGFSLLPELELMLSVALVFLFLGGFIDLAS